MKLILLNLVLAIISGIVSAYLVLVKRDRRSKVVAFLVMGASLWASGYAMEMFSIGLPEKLFWAKFQLLGMALTNVMPIFLAYFFDRDEWVTRKSIMGLSLVPLAFLAIVATDVNSGLIFSSVSLNLVQTFHPLIIEYGPIASGFLIYTYLWLVASFGFTAFHARGHSSIHWKKIVVSVVLFMLPVLSSIDHNFLYGGTTVDYTPAIFNILAIFCSVFIPLEMRDGSIFPLEYASILGEMKDMVILVDQYERITYVNPAAKRSFKKFFGAAEDDIVGRKLGRFIEISVTLDDESNEIELGNTSFDFSSFTLRDWMGRDKSWGFILRDITDRVTIEKKLQTLHRYAVQIANSGSFGEVASITKNALKDGLGFKEGCLLVFREGEVDLHINWGIDDSIMKEVASDPATIENLLKISEPLIVPNFNDFLSDLNFREVKALKRTTVVVPIQSDRETTGLLALYDGVENQFSEDDMNLLEIFGGHVGSAIQDIRHEDALHKRQEDEIKMILEGAGRVSSMVRHDLRGPLQTVKNAVYILKTAPDKITQMDPIINKSIDYMVKILEDLQYQDQPGNYNKVTLKLNTLIQQTLDYQMIPDHIKVETDLYENPVEHLMDKIKIQRMLDNLIRNAIEAMGDGGTLTISTRKCKHGTELKISDTGSGIEDMSKLFTPFHTTKINGMGLGLISVKQTLDAHNCMLEVESEPGKGTTFTIRFPEDPDYMGNSATKLSSITTT